MVTPLGTQVVNDERAMGMASGAVLVEDAAVPTSGKITGGVVVTEDVINEFVLRPYHSRYTATGYIQMQPPISIDPLHRVQNVELRDLSVEQRTQAQLLSHESLIARSKGPSDGALPSGNSVAADKLVYLGTALKEPKYLEQAEKTIAARGAMLKNRPLAYPRMFVALAALAEARAEDKKH